jgi:hypothetical protein
MPKVAEPSTIVLGFAMGSVCMIAYRNSPKLYPEACDRFGDCCPGGVWHGRRAHPVLCQTSSLQSSLAQVYPFGHVQGDNKTNQASEIPKKTQTSPAQAKEKHLPSDNPPIDA